MLVCGGALLEEEGRGNKLGEVRRCGGWGGGVVKKESATLAGLNLGNASPSPSPILGNSPKVHDYFPGLFVFCA